MCHIALKVVSARRVLEDGVTFWRTQTLHILLRVEASVGAWARNLGALQLFFNVVEARLGSIEARFAHMVGKEHVVACVLALARSLVHGVRLVEQTEGGRLFVHLTVHCCIRCSVIHG